MPPIIIFSIAILTRIYHPVSLAQMAVSQETHVEVCGPVVYVRHQKDGDWHITLDNGTTKVVAEIIPAIPFPQPHKGDIVRIRGIRRYDDRHHWPEVHPVEMIGVVTHC